MTAMDAITADRLFVFLVADQREEDTNVPKLRGIIFDFDGTIAETERFGQRVAYNRAFDELGLPWHWDETIYADLLTVAGGKERLSYYFERYWPASERPDAQLLTAIHGAKIRHFSTIAPEIPFRPGFARLVKEAVEAGVLVGIATTASLPGVEALLSQNRAIRDAIRFIGSNESVARKKPFPDVYEFVLRGLGLSAEDSVAVEDSNVGLAASRAAGIRTAITVSDYTSQDDFSRAAAVLSDLGEVGRSAKAFAGLSPEGGIVDVRYLQALLD